MQNPYPNYDPNGRNQLKLIPYFWPTQPKNHTLWDRTFLYSWYKGVPPPGRPHVQKTLTHFSDHEQQPETPSTVAVVPSDSTDTHFACDASIDVYKYGHSKRIYRYRYRYQWLWAKFRQRHVNPPKLRRGNVWNSDGDIKNPPNRASLY